MINICYNKNSEDDFMLRKIKENKGVDIPKLNDILSLSKNILKIVYFLTIIIAIYLVTIICKEWNIMKTVLSIISIVSPLFIGFFVAWLFNPFVTYLEEKGMRRGLGTLLTYILLIGFIYLLLSTIIPLLTSQINDFANNIPSILNTIYDWGDSIFAKFQSIDSIDITSIKQSIYDSIEGFGQNLTSSLPELSFKFIKSIFSGLGVTLIGLIIGFYLLMNFKEAEAWIVFIPKKMRPDTLKLLEVVNTTCRNFVTGAILDSLLIFMVSSIAFFITGLKAPLLFGLFCGITNVIPYAGPYIGGIPAVIVGFSISPTCGILTLLVLIIIQGLEGNFLQPLIMAKSTKLHPVTIMLGLLVFGHFFGILGMVISTPTIGVIKAIFMFLEEKYDLVSHLEEEG